MKEFKFNERTAIEKMIKMNFVDSNNITNTIYSLAKYNYHVLHLKDKANYNHILKYITTNCVNICEEGIYKDIEGCVKNAKKHTMAIIDSVCITKNELEIIQKLDDIKQEKVMFVLLAISKYFNKLNGQNYDSAFLTNSDICKMARLTIPTSERDAFMQFAYDKELLRRHTWADSTIKQVAFVSHDQDDKVVLRLNEGDFRDLAYTYLAYISPHQFRRCVSCGQWIRRNSHDIRLCYNCRASADIEQKNKFKTIKCVDCGINVAVSVFNSATCRCDDCYAKHRRIQKTEEMRKLRHKDSCGQTPE